MLTYADLQVDLRRARAAVVLAAQVFGWLFVVLCSFVVLGACSGRVCVCVREREREREREKSKLSMCVRERARARERERERERQKVKPLMCEPDSGNALRGGCRRHC
jgi:hypothetical protein